MGNEYRKNYNNTVVKNFTNKKNQDLKERNKKVFMSNYCNILEAFAAGAIIGYIIAYAVIAWFAFSFIRGILCNY